MSGLSALFSSAIAYLFRDLFTTNVAAGAVNGTAADPGVGNRIVTDATSILSIASGVLTANGTPAATSSFAEPSVARVAGRAFVMTLPTRTTLGPSGSVRWGLSGSASDNTVAIGVDVGSTANAFRIKDGTLALDNFVQSAGEHQYAFVMRATGGFLFFRAGTSGSWTLIWIYNTGTTTPLFPKIHFVAAQTSDFTSDDWRILDLGGLFATDYGLATDRKAISVAGDTITMTADAVVEHTLTAATGITQNLMLRRTDDNNCWIVRCDQGASTIAIIEKVAGVETSRNSVAQTWTNGTQYRVVITLDGTTIKTYVANVAKNTYASATTNQTATGAKVDQAGVDLVSWPRTVSIST